MAQKKAMITGSFDPFTKGHQWLVSEAVKLFDKVYVVIGKNQKKQYLSPIDKREEYIIKACSKFPKVEVVVGRDEELLVDHALELGVTYIVRGIRPADFEYENHLQAINAKLDDSIRTVFLIPPKELQEINSTAVRELINYSYELIETYLPEEIYMDYICDYAITECVYYLNKFEGPFAVCYDESVVSDILTKQTGKGRYYHTPVHIAYGLRNLDQLKDVQSNMKAHLAVALLFHDVIQGGENDVRESKHAYTQVATDTNNQIPFKSEILDAIQSTDHKNRPLKLICKLMCDLDLLIFSTRKPMYEWYSRMVRKEYAGVHWDEYRYARIKVLQKFLKRKEIYQAIPAKKRKDKTARNNINRELEKLKQSHES